ncbi:TCR/Tet family MFS transporter [Candidatus Beckwithbacteria bacterium]|nr:TCR/Tet family MFS transporter [Candidatus Beckwithbacteria bacterium]
MQKNKALIFLSIVMFVNALSYASIIPLFYTYSEHFGINPFGLSLLFSSFSIAQFLVTPILGRLSDRFGRKPILLVCLLGSSISLAVFGSAQSITMLFIARIIDGITGGNNSVAQAALADITQEKDRAKAFGMLGAIFGVGFLLGPAIGGLMGKISLSAPFWFASGLALLGVIIGLFLLQETNKQQKVSVKEPLFRFKVMYEVLFTPLVGTIILINFLIMIAQNSWILGFQAFTVDVLELSSTTIGFLFSLSGLLTIILQGFGIKILLNKVNNKQKILKMSLFFSTLIVALIALANNFLVFLTLMIIYNLIGFPLMPVVSALISEGTKAEDQGGIMGINQSFTSLGQIIGPVLAGIIAEKSVNLIFILSASIIFIAYLLTTRLKAHFVRVDL